MCLKNCEYRKKLGTINECDCDDYIESKLD